jgi:anti-sigma factor RsiW
MGVITVTEPRGSTECRELFARLSEYLDGDLSLSLCEAFRAHLDACRPCDAFTATLRRTIELCRALPAGPLPDDLHARLKTLLAHPETAETLPASLDRSNEGATAPPSPVPGGNGGER